MQIFAPPIWLEHSSLKIFHHELFLLNRILGMQNLSSRMGESGGDPTTGRVPDDDPAMPRLSTGEGVGLYSCRFRTRNIVARSNNLPNSLSASKA